MLPQTYNQLLAISSSMLILDYKCHSQINVCLNVLIMFKCHGLINISDNLIKRNNYLLKCGKIPKTCDKIYKTRASINNSGSCHK